MSYDLFFFRMHESASAETINQFIETPEFETYLDQKGDEEPMVPARFVSSALSQDELTALLAKSHLRVSVDEEERTEALVEYLDSDASEAPAAWRDEVESMFEYAGFGGMQPVSFSHGGDLGDALQNVVEMLYDLEEQRIAVYDPQLNLVMDASNAEEIFSGMDDEGE